MSVRQHLFATLAVCLAITLGALWVLHVQQRREAETLAANFADERRQQLGEAVAEESESLGVFVQDYSSWDDMVAFATTLDPEWARFNLEQVLERFRLDAVWLVAPDGRLLYSVFAEGGPRLSPPPAIPQVVAQRDWAGEAGGFYEIEGRVIDLRARPVQPTSDIERRTRPAAWLLAGRVLGPEATARLERKLQAEVSLQPAALERERAPAGRVVVRHPLGGVFDPAPVAEWHAAFRTDALDLGDDYNDREMVVWVVSVLLLLGVFGWSIHRNVLRPLAVISDSLERDSPAPLVALGRGSTEFGRISDLVRESFQQRERLRVEIEERIRLGRDLHDGVIQNLYATGMGIAHGLRLVPTDPARATERLGETLRTLNETMETLRGFIVRAEPEASEQVDFTDACVSLFQTLRVQRECELDLDVAPGADAAIPASDKAHLLFIAREAISNALRHGQARHIAISLKPVAAGWRLVVANDGRDHDFSLTTSCAGHGLDNIRARARELGGAPAFRGRAGGGVEIVVEWSSPAALTKR